MLLAVSFSFEFAFSKNILLKGIGHSASICGYSVFFAFMWTSCVSLSVRLGEIFLFLYWAFIC